MCFSNSGLRPELLQLFHNHVHQMSYVAELAKVRAETPSLSPPDHEFEPSCDSSRSQLQGCHLKGLAPLWGYVDVLFPPVHWLPVRTPPRRTFQSG